MKSAGFAKRYLRTTTVCPFEHYHVVRPIAMSVTAAAVIVVVGLCGLVSGQQPPSKPMAKTTEVLTDVLLKVRMSKSTLGLLLLLRGALHSTGHCFRRYLVRFAIAIRRTDNRITTIG